MTRLLMIAIQPKQLKLDPVDRSEILEYFKWYPPTLMWTLVCLHPKINIEPEDDGLEDDFPLPGMYSQVPC